MDPYFLDQNAGEIAVLGVAEMRLLLSHKQTNGALAVGQFRGSAGPWTVSHVHRELDEFFYVLDGQFRFTCGSQELNAEPGAFLMVPRGTAHVFTAESDGAILVLWTPGGLEEMFLELGRLPAASLTDPVIRAEMGQRYDSVPT